MLRACLHLAALQLALAVRFTHLGGFPCRAELTAGPGFASFAPDGTLLVSQFTGDPLEKDSISIVQGLPALLAAGNVSGTACRSITSSVLWPNFVEYFSSGSGAGDVTGVLAPGGFLVPPKTIGAVSLVPVDFATGLAQPPRVLSTPKILPGDGFFYHRAFPFDVDGDGLLDLLAARAMKPLSPFTPSAGELIWLQRPAVAQPFEAPNLPWKEAVLRSGPWAPDVGFTPPVSLRSDSSQEVYYTSFFTGGGLAMLQCAQCGDPASGQHWATANLTLTVLDASLGPAFDVAVADLNGDGVPDLLVTNHADNATAPHIASQVVAYVAPPPGTPLTNASAWGRHVLASGFLIREPGPNQASPGEASALQLPGGGKAVVLVSGDGEQRWTALLADSSSPGDWGYSRQEVWDCGGTTGKQASVVVEGVLYVLLPCYDAGTVQAFRVEA